MVRNKLTRGGGYLCTECRGINKAASNLSQRAAICLGLSPVWERRARERVAQTGPAPEKPRGQLVLG